MHRVISRRRRERASFAIVTSASSGIGLALAGCCAAAGYDLLVVAEGPEIALAAHALRKLGVSVDAVRADLATTRGQDALYAAMRGRPVDALLADAGLGRARAFLGRRVQDVRCVVDSNVTGPLGLIYSIGRDMRARGVGKILISAAHSSTMSAEHRAAYDGTRALLDSFSHTLRAELVGSGVSVTCVMPGLADAGLLEPDQAARAGFEAMIRGEGRGISGGSRVA